MGHKKNSFFQKILNFFIPPDSPEAIKRRRLKLIAKNISKTKYSRWYKISGQELQPSLASFLYSVYKIVGPARPLLASAIKSKILKTITVEDSLSKKQKELLENFSEVVIAKRIQQSDPADLAAKIKEELKTFISEFDSTQAERTDAIYEHLETFINFVLFDYYFILKKFDSNMMENNFTYVPVFKPIRGEYVSEELKDFAVILYQLAFNTDWKTIFKIIKLYKNIQPVHEGQWKKLLSTLNDIKKSNIFEFIIQHSNEDILYKVEKIPFLEKVTDSYIDDLKKSTQSSINKILNEQKAKKTAILVNRIFGDKISYPMKNYSLENNKVFIKKGLPGFIYTEAMGYLKSFLIDYVKTDIRSLCDLFLVRGNWGGTSSITADYSNSFHSIMKISPKVAEFDEKISETSELGVKFRTLLSRMEREKEAKKQLLKYLNELNETALKLLNISVKHLIVIAGSFKNIIADYDKPRRSLLQNWKEIEHNADKPIREWLVEGYKKIYDFVVLIQLFQKQVK